MYARTLGQYIGHVVPHYNNSITTYLWDLILYKCKFKIFSLLLMDIDISLDIEVTEFKIVT